MNPSALSRAHLVRELLGPHPSADSKHATPYVGDDEAAYPVGSTKNEALARKLDVARELLMRDLIAQMCAGTVMHSPSALRDWLRLYCAHLDHEVFLVLYLSVQNRLIAAEEMFRGSLTQTSVYPREIVKSALTKNAAAVVLAHNHPSGGPLPSRADEALTQTLKSALALIDVRVLDHFIVAGTELTSLAERGLL